MLEVMLLFDCEPYDYHASRPNRNRDADSDRYYPTIFLRLGISGVGFRRGFWGSIWVPSGDGFGVRRIEE